MVLVPTNYKERKYNWDSVLELKGYPMVNWQYDASKAGLLKMRPLNCFQVTGSAASIGLGGGIRSASALASPGMLAGGGIMGILNSINTIGLASMMPNVVRGSHSSVNTGDCSKVR